MLRPMHIIPFMIFCNYFGMKCLHCKCILLNVNVYGPTELKSLPHIFEIVYTKWNVGLNSYFVFVYVLVNELG